MTYYELFRVAIKKLDNDEITLGEYEKLIAPLHREVDTLDKIRAEIEQNAYPIVHGVNNHEKGMTLYGILQVIDKYSRAERSGENE